MKQRVLTAILCAVGVVRVAAAQDSTRVLQLADRGPRFLYAPTHGETPADARGAAVFRRTIALSLADAPVADALAAISRAAGMRIVYKTDVLPTGTTVSIDAGRITVAAALTDVLQDVAVDVELTGTGIVTLVARARAGAASTQTRLASAASITGLVVDSATGATVPHVIVRIDETGQSTESGPQGRYTIVDVVPGEYRVTAKRVGFIPRTRLVTVQENRIVTLDFKLSRPATKLDEVVTTGTGDQRRFQVGNVISTVNVDSIAPTAPITSVTDILASRVPGLEVVEASGLTGSGEAIRIRGQSSIELQSDPIIIVDGVRQDNSAGGSFYSTFTYVVPTPSRLNDIDVSQIATIDVLKGPAASTEYGTDAANGVIVITTKRGASGKPQWHLSAEEGLVDIPTSFPDYYYSVGHLTDGSNTATQCPLVTYSYLPQATKGTCAVDSVTHDNPLNHSATSIYGTGNRGKYGLDVSGGSDAIRYFLAGGLSNETGALRLPPAFRSQAESFGFPRSVLNPNSEAQRSGRANTYFRVGSTADVALTVAYLSTFQTIPALGSGLSYGAAAGGPLDAANNYGWGATYQTPLATITNSTDQQTDRFTGGLSGNWRPTSWFSLFADAGVDHGAEQNHAISLPQASIYQGYGPNSGAYQLGQMWTDIYSADLRGSATAALTPGLRAVTTFGLNLRDTRTSGIVAFAYNLSGSNLTLVGAASPYVNQSGSRSATLGGYAEEQLQIAERLFVIGALRVDAASGFGDAYQTATYPKLSASWLAVQQGPTTVRLRGAFGASGVAPYNGLALQLFAPVVVAASGGPVSAVQLTQPGNPNLKPERTGEWEGGVDLGMWGNRLSVDLTGYYKTTQDALYSSTLGWDLGNAPYEINVGEIRNTGLEAQISAIPVETRAVTWAMTLNASVNHNHLVHLAPGLAPLNVGETQRIQPGYPLYGFWGYQEHYADGNHDGIIEPNEVTVDKTATYMGSSIPTQQGSFDTHVTLLGGTLSVGGMLTYQGGYRIYNAFAQRGAQDGTLREQNVAGSPLWLQARAVAYTNGSYPGSQYASGFFEDGTVLRFQELSLTYALPTHWARAARIHTLSVTGAIRNLAFWTRYSGGDPSSNFSIRGYTRQLSTNTYTVNNDIRGSGDGAVPLARYFQLRLNVGF